jgi:hypothetical protein
MNVQEMLDEFAERLAIDIADGTLTEDEEQLLLKLLAEIEQEKAEKGYVEFKRMTPEVLAMDWDDFIAECQRNVKQS